MSQPVDLKQRLKDIGQRLAQARKTAGLSQTQAARLMGLSEVASTISGWELGRGGLSMEHFMHLCEIYDVSEEWVLTGVNPDFDPAELMQKIDQSSGLIKDELEDLMELFAMLRQDKGGA